MKQVLDFARQCGASGSQLFDVGCFDGGLLDLAEADGWQGWGLELQGEAAAQAGSRRAGRIAETTVEAFDPSQKACFDVVTAVGLIEHLRQPASLFALAATLLRPAGLLVIQTPNRESLPARLLGRYWPPIAPPEHTFYFGKTTLSRLCARHGFQQIAARRHVKRLRLGYAYEQFQHFGPEFHAFLGPVMRRLPQRALDARLPLYGGEVLFAARRGGA